MSQPLVPPDGGSFHNVQKLCEISDPYVSNSDIDSIFVQAFNEIIDWHRENSSFYASLTKDIDKFDSIPSLQNLPFVHANFFKLHEVLSITKDDIFEHLTSSGTSGQKSQMFFDRWSILSARRMVEFVYDSIGFNTPDSEANYILFAYEPLSNFKVGTTNTNILQGRGSDAFKAGGYFLSYGRFLELLQENFNYKGVIQLLLEIENTNTKLTLKIEKTIDAHTQSIRELIIENYEEIALSVNGLGLVFVVSLVDESEFETVVHSGKIKHIVDRRGVE